MEQCDLGIDEGLGGEEVADLAEDDTHVGIAHYFGGGGPEGRGHGGRDLGRSGELRCVAGLMA